MYAGFCGVWGGQLLGAMVSTWSDGPRRLGNPWTFYTPFSRQSRIWELLLNSVLQPSQPVLTLIIAVSRCSLALWRRVNEPISLGYALESIWRQLPWSTTLFHDGIPILCAWILVDHFSVDLVSLRLGPEMAPWGNQWSNWRLSSATLIRILPLGGYRHGWPQSLHRMQHRKALQNLRYGVYSFRILCVLPLSNSWSRCW